MHVLCVWTYFAYYCYCVFHYHSFTIASIYVYSEHITSIVWLSSKIEGALFNVFAELLPPFSLFKSMIYRLDFCLLDRVLRTDLTIKLLILSVVEFHVFHIFSLLYASLKQVKFADNPYTAVALTLTLCGIWKGIVHLFQTSNTKSWKQIRPNYVM